MGLRRRDFIATLVGVALNLSLSGHDPLRLSAVKIFCVAKSPIQ
jgi:hypothetical protein